MPAVRAFGRSERDAGAAAEEHGGEDGVLRGLAADGTVGLGPDGSVNASTSMAGGLVEQLAAAPALEALAPGQARGGVGGYAATMGTGGMLPTRGSAAPGFEDLRSRPVRQLRGAVFREAEAAPAATSGTGTAGGEGTLGAGNNDATAAGAGHGLSLTGWHARGGEVAAGDTTGRLVGTAALPGARTAPAEQTLAIREAGPGTPAQREARSRQTRAAIRLGRKMARQADDSGYSPMPMPVQHPELRARVVERVACGAGGVTLAFAPAMTRGVTPGVFRSSGGAKLALFGPGLASLVAMASRRR